MFRGTKKFGQPCYTIIKSSQKHILPAINVLTINDKHESIACGERIIKVHNTKCKHGKRKNMRHKNQLISSPRSRSVWFTILENHENKKKTFLCVGIVLRKGKL